MTIRFLSETILKDNGDDYMTAEEYSELLEQLKANDAEYCEYAKLYSFEYTDDYGDDKTEYLLIFRDYDDRGAHLHYDGLNAAIGCNAEQSVLTADNRHLTDFCADPSEYTRYSFGWNGIRVTGEEERSSTDLGDSFGATRFSYSGDRYGDVTTDDVVETIKDYLNDGLSDDAYNAAVENIVTVGF